MLEHSVGAIIQGRESYLRERFPRLWIAELGVILVGVLMWWFL